MVFRADAAFAKPEIYEALEERKVKYTIRLPANDNLERKVAQLLKRPVGRPPGATLSRERLIELITRSNDLGVWIADQLAIGANGPGEDILSSIGHGVETGALSARAGIVILQTLLAAGGESTTSLLGSAVRLLADHQDLQQHLRQQPELIPNFVEEALRLESPFRHHMRSVPKDTTLGDVDIPAGATLLMLWGAATWRSGVTSTSASVLPSLASRRGSCSGCCSSTPAASPLTPTNHPGGSTASWSDVTSLSPCNSFPTYK